MLSCHINVCSFRITVLAGEWAIGAIIHLVLLELTSLETITTGVRTGHCRKPALPLNRVLAQMSVETAQLSTHLQPWPLLGQRTLSSFTLRLKNLSGMVVRFISLHTGQGCPCSLETACRRNLLMASQQSHSHLQELQEQPQL